MRSRLKISLFSVLYLAFYYKSDNNVIIVNLKNHQSLLTFQSESSTFSPPNPILNDDYWSWSYIFPSRISSKHIDMYTIGNFTKNEIIHFHSLSKDQLRICSVKEKEHFALWSFQVNTYEQFNFLRASKLWLFGCIMVFSSTPLLNSNNYQFSSVQSLSHVRLFATPWISARQSSLSITNSRSSLRLNVHRVSDAIQPSHPLPSPSPAPSPSQHQSLFQWVNSSHEVAKVLGFQLQHHSLQRNPRADLLQNGLVGYPCSPRTLKNLLQHYSSKASILRCSFYPTNIRNYGLLYWGFQQMIWSHPVQTPTHIGSPWHHPSEVSTSICLLTPSDGRLTTLPRLVGNLGRDQFNLEVGGLWAVEH